MSNFRYWILSAAVSGPAVAAFAAISLAAKNRLFLAVFVVVTAWFLLSLLVAAVLAMRTDPEEPETKPPFVPPPMPEDAANPPRRSG